jgi:hypothetical protein
MKVLLDECLPVDLRLHIANHEVFTVAFMAWKGLKNGRLLSAAAQAGFEVMVTADGGIPYQQDPARLPFAVVVLNAASNQLADLLPLVPALQGALDALPAKGIYRVQ